MNKAVLFVMLLSSLLLSGCRKGTTLEELAKMSPLERQELTEIYLEVDMPEGSEIDFWKTFEGCTNLISIEFDERFKGTITGHSRHAGPSRLQTLIAKGATVIGNNTFYAGADWKYNENIEFVQLPSVKYLGPHAFGGYKGTNQIRTLDFPNLRWLVDSNIKGCRNLTTLKLGYDGPIMLVFDKELNTENIDLYIGKYEYENHVKGNVLYPYEYLDIANEYVKYITGDHNATVSTDIENAKPSGEPVVFKSIQPYK